MIKGFFILLMFSFVHLFAASLSKEDQILAIKEQIRELETHYGMIEFKKKHFEITYEKILSKYIKIINESNLDKEGLRTLQVQLAGEFQDGHFNVAKKRGNYYTFGIVGAEVEGRLFVAGFNKVYNAKNSGLPVEVGDEIISLNGISIQELAKKNLPYARSLGGTYSSQNSRALSFTINRPERFLPNTTKNGETVEVAFKKIYFNGTEKIYTGVYQWVDLNELYNEQNFYTRFLPGRKKVIEKGPYIYGAGGNTETQFSEGLNHLGLPTGSIIDLKDLINVSIEEQIKDTIQSNSEIGRIEAIRKLGLMPINRLGAYMVKYKNKTIGVLRIPDYSPGWENIKYEINWINKVIQYFNLHSDIWIFDHNDNGGGALHYAEHFFRFFASETGFKGVKENMKLSDTFFNMVEGAFAQKDLNVENIGNNSDQDVYNSIKQNFAEAFLNKQFIEKLKAKFEKGEEFSGFFPVFSTVADFRQDASGTIYNGSAVVNQRPVLTLNDHHAGSLGDMVPWILQLNGKTEILGTNSSGLGGPVYRSNDNLPASENFMRCTYAYCEAHNGLPVENVGAVVDYHRPVYLMDLKTNFKYYTKDVLEVAILKLENKSKSEIQSFLRSSQLERDRQRTTKETSEFMDFNNEFYSELGNIPVDDFSAITAHYRKNQKKFLKMLELVPDSMKKYVYIPVPMALNVDLILSTLHRSDSIVDRLEYMLTMDKYKELRPMIRAVLPYHRVSTQTYSTNNCQTYLMIHSKTE
ncbi:MAG: hypothetical protein H6622_05440 [Halobacteriovoraceae bacterium]|nr:hypothetical protein [Halobacteriovoraceae bacterium]